MRFRTLTSAIAAAGIAMVMMTGAVQAAEAAKYPDWKGAWTRWFPPGSVLEPNGGFTAGGQPSHDQTKPWGRGQEAPLAPEYQKVFEESLADQAYGFISTTGPSSRNVFSATRPIRESFTT